MHELSDEQLVLAYQAQSSAAAGQAFLNELFTRHHTRVALWCYRMTADRQWGADLAQDIFLKAFRHLGSFRGDSKFTTWLYTIARNHCATELKARAARPEETIELSSLPLADPGEAADASVERKRSERLLRQLMQEVLDETERNVMTWHYADELPLDAITRLLGLTNPSGAKAYIVSARRKLHNAIVRAKGLSAQATAHEVRND